MQWPTTNKLDEKKNLFKLNRNTIVTEWFDEHDRKVEHLPWFAQSSDLVLRQFWVF